MRTCKTFINAQIVHHRAQRVVRKWSPSTRPVLAYGSGPRDRAATEFWVEQRPLGFLKLPHQAARVLWCCRRSHLALPRVTAATPVCRTAICRVGHGLHGNIFRTTTSAIVPIWQFQRPTRRSPLSSGEDDGLGEELRVLLAHSMRGHHTANARRHDPPGPHPVTSG
jgi:hypothetical protein